MKKILALVLACVMVLSLCACTQGKVKNTDSPKNDRTEQSSTPVDDKRSTPTTTDTPNEGDGAQTGDPASSGDIEVRTEDTEPTGMTVETGAAHGVKLMDTPPSVELGLYTFTEPVSVDEELGFVTYEMPIKLEESSLTERYQKVGEFDTQEAFLEAWTPYAEGLFDAIRHDGVLTEVSLYGEEDNGDHIFGNDADNKHSYSLDCDPSGYQSVNYTLNIFVDTANEGWDHYDYSELAELIQYYTGIMLTTGDIYNLQSMIAEKLEAGAEKWYIDVRSNEQDCYDSFSIAGYNFMEGVQSWHFTTERTISKWADLYDREALRNGLIVGSDEG